MNSVKKKKQLVEFVSENWLLSAKKIAKKFENQTWSGRLVKNPL